MEEEKRTLAYVCPACRQTVVISRSVFELAAAPNRLPCPCGQSQLEVTLHEREATVRVPCLFCGREHAAACSAHAFLHKEVLAFSCAASGMDCCYTGREGAVFAAVGRLEAAVDKAETAAGEQGSFLNDVVMHEVLSELRAIIQRGGVSCTCGEKALRMDIKYSVVHLICGACGGVLRIPAAVSDDIDRLCCKQRLQIPGG